MLTCGSGLRDNGREPVKRPATTKIGGKLETNHDPTPGTVLTREYKGQTVEVQVHAGGLRVRGRGLPVAQRRRQGDHRHA